MRKGERERRMFIPMLAERGFEYTLTPATGMLQRAFALFLRASPFPATIGFCKLAANVLY